MELLIGSSIMLVVILATLSLYMSSSKISVDQQQFAELQNEVRSGMFFISRDVRHTGVGLPVEYMGYYLEGIDNENQGGTVLPDRVKLMGNIEDPLNLEIESYQGSTSTDVSLVDFSFEQYHYTDDYYNNKHVAIFPNPDSGCVSADVRVVTQVTHPQAGTGELLILGPAPNVEPPGGLLGTCVNAGDYDGGTIAFVEVKEYWLDVTGNNPILTAGLDGYIGNGVGGVLYMTQNGFHYPMAQNIENLQIEYNGNFDDDPNGTLDGFMDWNPLWTGDPIMVSRIQQVRIWVLGRTPNAFLSVSGTPPANLHIYRRPTLANSPADVQDDRHRRFLLGSTVNIRNRTINIYNTGVR